MLDLYPHHRKGAVVIDSDHTVVSKCVKCGKILAFFTLDGYGEVYIIFAPHTRIVLGVHPQALDEDPGPRPEIWKFLGFCEECFGFSLPEKLRTTVIPEITDPNRMEWVPDLRSGPRPEKSKGHFVTLTEFGEYTGRRYFNFQCNRKRFARIVDFLRSL